MGTNIGRQSLEEGSLEKKNMVRDQLEAGRACLTSALRASYPQMKEG